MSSFAQFVEGQTPDTDQVAEFPCGAPEWETIQTDESITLVPERDCSPVLKPVSLRGQVWDFDELIACWKRTGDDLSGARLSSCELSRDLRRVPLTTSLLGTYISGARNDAEKERRRKVASLLRGKCSMREGRIAVEGALELNCNDLMELEELPDICFVNGRLLVNEEWGARPSLTALPKDLHVRGSLSLKGCSALTTLADGLSVKDDLDLSSCYALTTLPTDLDVGGSLKLGRCSALTALPNKINVGSSLSCSDCAALTTLPEQLHLVQGDLGLSRCSALKALPKRLHVWGDLYLSYCEALTALPEMLVVGEDLDLSGCTALTTLAEGLRVEGDLDLTGCSALTALPIDFHVGGDLKLENCSALESLPASILAWPERNIQTRHNIYLSGSGLSQDTLEWIQATDAPHVRFHVDLGDASNEPSSTPLFATVSKAISFWKRESGAKETISDQEINLSRTDESTVLGFLSNLRSAKEFAIIETRRALAQRVLKALELIKNPELRVEVIQRMEDSLDACHDKPVWALNQLTLVGLISSARGEREKLRELGRRVLSLYIVHKHVQRKIASLSWVDDVCVYLRFEIELREALHLPVGATTMIFPNYIKITREELQAAEQEASEVTEEAFDSWLKCWTEWKRQGRYEFAKSLHWEDLDIDLSTTASDLPETDFSGEALVDPVVLHGQVWSLHDLLRHWVVTGTDLTNSLLLQGDIASSVKRVLKR